MIRFKGLKLAGAPQLLSWAVRRHLAEGVQATYFKGPESEMDGLLDAYCLHPHDRR